MGIGAQSQVNSTMNKSDRIKSEMSLRVAAEQAGAVWDMKKSKVGKGDWWSPCPLHAEASASFHVVEPGGRGGVFKCFGCGAGGSIIDFTMAHLGVDFIPAIRQLEKDGGLEGELSEDAKVKLQDDHKRRVKNSEVQAAREAERGHKAARKIWRKSRANDETVRRYLTNRGVRLSVIGGVPASLRGQPDLEHWEGAGVSHTGPAMIGIIGREQMVGVHRTWITDQARACHQDGRKVSKQWRGRTGSMMGCPVVLSPPTPAVVVGEGIETTLTAFAGLAWSGKLGWCAEAALSRGAITGPTSDAAHLWTPRPGTLEVMLLGEGSSRDPDMARDLYHTARDRLTGLGLKVHLTVPNGAWDQDLDFADLALIEFQKG